MVEGDRVRLKLDAPLRRRHPELAGAIGVVSSVVRGPASGRLDTSQQQRATDIAVHVRFGAINLVAISVPASQFEVVGNGLDPNLGAVPL